MFIFTKPNLPIIRLKNSISNINIYSYIEIQSRLTKAKSWLKCPNNRTLARLNHGKREINRRRFFNKIRFFWINNVYIYIKLHFYTSIIPL